MSITFGGVELKNVEPFDTKPILTKKSRVLGTGEESIQRSTKKRFFREYHCHTDSYSDVSALLAVDIGLYDLVEDGTTYDNCEIWEWLKIQQNPQGTRWDYSFTVRRHTA